MTDDRGPLALAAFMVLLCAFVLGVAVGWVGHAKWGGAPKGAVISGVVVEASRSPAPLGRRCVNGPDPRAWTVAEVEARYHSAKVWHETAETAGVWNGRGARAFRLAMLGYLEVLACTADPR